MAKVVKRADLSKKDYRVDTGVLRVKDSVFNIISDIGDGSRADFNEIDPLLYWAAPANPKTGAVAHVLFNDGLGYYTFNGTEWALNFFYPSSAYVSPGPKVYKALLTQSGTNAPVATVLENTLGFTVDWIYEGEGSYKTNTEGLLIENTYLVFFGDARAGNRDVKYIISGDNEIELYTYLNGVQSDSVIASSISVLIEVYP